MIDNIFIATSTFSAHSKVPLAMLDREKRGIIINPLSRKLSPNELIKYASDSTGIVAGTELYSRDVLSQLPNLKVISRLGIGMDNVDLEATKERNIQVFKTKTTPAPAVAELVIGLMIDVARKITIQHQKITNGNWEKEMGVLMQGKTLGIVGLGSIGKTLVKLVKGFNLKILAFDLFHDDKFAKEHKVNYCDIDTLLIKSDIVSIHLNLSDETKKFMNEDQFYKMKPESILINTSRGEIIDEDALFTALKEKKILGAGLDVFNNEPYFGSLKKLDNAVLTPHIGAYAKELRINMEIEAVNNLIRGLNEG